MPHTRQRKLTVQYLEEKNTGDCGLEHVPFTGPLFCGDNEADVSYNKPAVNVPHKSSLPDIHTSVRPVPLLQEEPLDMRTRSSTTLPSTTLPSTTLPPTTLPGSGKNLVADTGRISVASCDSDDSGLSGDVSPMSTLDTKPFTISIRSPSKSGLLQVIPDRFNGYVGFFRPISPKPETPDSTKAPNLNRQDSSTSIASKISKSAPQVKRQYSQTTDQSDNQPVTKRRSTDSNRPSTTKQTYKDSPSKRKISYRNSSIATSSEIKTSRNRTKSPIKPNTKSKLNSKSKAEAKNSKRLSPNQTIQNRRSLSSRDSRSRLTKSKPSSSASTAEKLKRHKLNLLKRIQHHNKSPERPSDAKLRQGRTRSSAKILRESPEVKGKLSRPPRIYRVTQRTLSDESSSTNAADTCSLGSASPHTTPVKLGVKPPIQFVSELSRGSSVDGSEDSGVASDDQSSTAVKSACHWRFCKASVSSPSLVDHLDRVHVASQRRNSKVYRCYWEGCKVYGKIAKSLIWLEGHVKKHLGAHPYHCIFEGCTRRFSSAELLQKHVDTHFDQQEQSRVSKKCEPVVKKDKKNTKRLRGTERCLPRRGEFFTANILEAVKWKQKLLQERWGYMLNEERDALRLHGQIIALCKRKMGNTDEIEERVQLHWYPEEFNIPDSWHLKSDIEVEQRTKLVKLADIPNHLLYY